MRAPARRAARIASRSLPSVAQSFVEEHADGLVCLSGCARNGLAVHDPNAAARLARAFGRERFFVELQRPYERGDVRRNAALRDLAEHLGVAHRRHRQRACPRGAAHAAPGHARRDPLPHLARRLRAGAAGQPREHPARAGRGGRALRRHRPGRRRPHRRDRGAPAVRPHRGARLPLSRLLRRRRAGDPAARRDLQRRLRRPLSAARPAAARPGARSPRERARADRRARAGRVLPAPLGGARARPGMRPAGARSRLAPPLPAAGARARQLGRLDRLLPHRPLARRSGRERSLARALPQPRAGLGPGHRPRLPARHPREADRRRHRALRQRARLARRELRHLPLARRDPRRRQGARAAAGRARADRPAQRRLGCLAHRRGGGRPSGCRAQAGLEALARLPVPRRPRSPACRATSPSTRAAW